MAESLRNHADAAFAVEESGKYIWPKVLMYGDAALASGKLLRIMKWQKKSLEDLRSTLPQFHLLKQNVPCPDCLKSKAMELVMAGGKDYGNAEVLTIDGLRVTYPDYSWFLVRFSGTEPVLRCYGEGAILDEARRLLNIATELAQTSIARASRVSSHTESHKQVPK
jgi:phosphomannomutase/phosphoglucomutase